MRQYLYDFFFAFSHLSRTGLGLGLHYCQCILLRRVPLSAFAQGHNATSMTNGLGSKNVTEIGMAPLA